MTIETEINTFSGFPLIEKEQRVYDEYLEWSEEREGWTEYIHAAGKNDLNFDSEKVHFEVAMHDIVCAITSVFYYHVHKLGWEKFEDNEEQIKQLTKIVGDDLIDRIKWDLQQTEEMHEEHRQKRAAMRAERVAKGLPPDYTPEEIEQQRKEARASFEKWQAEQAAERRAERARLQALHDAFGTPGCDCPACRAKREGAGDSVAH